MKETTGTYLRVHLDITDDPAKMLLDLAMALAVGGDCLADVTGKMPPSVIDVESARQRPTELRNQPDDQGRYQDGREFDGCLPTSGERLGKVGARLCTPIS